MLATAGFSHLFGYQIGDFVSILSAFVRRLKCEIICFHAKKR